MIASYFYDEITEDIIEVTMLQRVQTIFLAITIIGMGAFVSFPVWTKVAASGEQAILEATKLTHQINSVQSEVQPLYYLIALAVLVAGVSAYAIISFKNRVLQSALCAVNSILLTVMMGLVIYFSFYKTAKLFEPELPGKYEIGFYGLVAAMLANVFANRFIRKDERMVQKSNRLR
jgi:glucan phosphoethanolaminetransferase (alkaline phosphatase superfamily)